MLSRGFASKGADWTWEESQADGSAEVGEIKADIPFSHRHSNHEHKASKLVIGAAGDEGEEMNWVYHLNKGRPSGNPSRSFHHVGRALDINAHMCFKKKRGI